MLYEVKSSSLLLSGLYDLHGAVFIYLSEMGDVYFKAGLYEINIYQLIKGHLVGYLGEYESAIAQLNSEYLSVERAYSKASNEERSEKNIILCP
ncbi:hypothetical protein [Aeromonas veronii]|uniref:hypothetical protein n=1 Tax=Aeromonas veronii TaxID=654 RepID=UPI00244403F2|nr:hypothetical protein [Aeromonas veronii]